MREYPDIDGLAYLCQSKRIPGQSASTVFRVAKDLFHEISRKTKRRPYFRSAYFGGRKIFFDYFWPHLWQKNISERKRRLSYFEAAIELIKLSKKPPFEINIFKDQVLYRFLGKVHQDTFIVQIKEDRKRDQRFFMSVFEYNKK